ncbi:hypothetical protein L3X38_018776 [Prunus dulcis]|uniref:Uncharacterized protein n=1 Tax=Prunus dulcis TaxID=3755 RepID=A0AAD4ZBG0_PRUDU|nr:hypothetical protein L3X38_018776 [Prunus dulcis]
MCLVLSWNTGLADMCSATWLSQCKVASLGSGSCSRYFRRLRPLFSSSEYEEHGEKFVDMLDGMLSFVLLDMRDNSYIAA